MKADEDVMVYCRDCYTAIYEEDVYVMLYSEDWNCDRYYCEECAEKKRNLYICE